MVMRNKNIKVTIVTVCYNSAATIEKTIQSVINQSYPNIEYIIIDGGSTDGTVDIIRKYEDRIAYWVSEPDGGIYDAMNKGIKAAHGEIVGIINSDDWYVDNILNLVVRTFQNNIFDILYGDIYLYYDGMDITQRYPSTSNISELNWCMGINHPSVFVRKKIYEEYGVFSTKFYLVADYDLMLRFYQQKCVFHYVPIPLAVFRIGGLTSEKQWRTMIEERNIALQYLSALPGRRQMEIFPEIMNHNLERRKALRHELLCRQIQRKCLCNEVWKICQRELLGDKMQLAIFGTGEVGKSCYISLRKLFGSAANIPFFLDNSSCKEGHKLDNVVICRPEEVCDRYQSILIVIASEKYRQEMIHQLMDFGFEEGKDWITVDVLRKKMTLIEHIVSRRYLAQNV